MPRVTQVLRRAHKAIQDLDLLRILGSELNHELSSMRYQDEKVCSFGDFVLEWDSPQSQDVLLRKKCSSGEEVAVSALLGHETFQGDGRLPREALMKICVKKPGLSSILQFDCVASNSRNQLYFFIHNANYIPSSSCLDSSTYKGPIFSDLDFHLQVELMRYLARRGIENNFANSLLLYLHRREQAQYTSWLQKLRDLIAEDG